VNVLKKVFLVLMVLVVFVGITPVSIAHIEIDYDEEGSCVILPHTYEVNITNTYDSRDIFRVRTPREFSTWFSLSNNLLRINSDETRTIEISINAPRNIELGEYKTQFSVISENYREVSESSDLCFIVLRDYSMVFRDFILEKVDYGPNEEVRASVVVENDGTKDFEDGEFYIEVTGEGEMVGSHLEEFILETGKSKTVSASVDLQEYQTPGDYKINYEVRGAGHTIKSGEEPFGVIEIADYQTEVTSDGRYIIRTNTIHAQNKGNIVEEKNIEERIGFPISLLVTAEDVEIRRDGLSRTYIWNIELEPGESTQMSYEINYWPLYILIVLIALITFRAYLYMKAPVIKKEVVKSEVSEDKRILTISLHVKNRLFGKAKNVIIEDSVPSVTRVLDKFDTVKPNIIRQGDDTVLRWKLGDMGPGDDRVVHYKAKVLVESIDELIFPEARARGSVDGRTFERSSSKVRLGI